VTRDGSKAAESYFRRRRGVLVNLLGYAIESGELDTNPLAKLNEKAPKKSGPIESVDRLQPGSGRGHASRHLLRRQLPPRPRPPAGGLLHHALLRHAPSGGSLNVHDYECTLPDDPNSWDEIRLAKTKPTAGRRWTDSGDIHDTRVA
jgi:hypothetical protein